jgi:hypothetical protein
MAEAKASTKFTAIRMQRRLYSKARRQARSTQTFSEYVRQLIVSDVAEQVGPETAAIDDKGHRCHPYYKGANKNYGYKNRNAANEDTIPKNNKNTSSVERDHCQGKLGRDAALLAVRLRQWKKFKFCCYRKSEKRSLEVHTYRVRLQKVIFVWAMQHHCGATS